MIDDRPTTAERYSGAIDSSHLEVLPTRCDVDYLVAAGWVQDGLGTTLFRLRTEYDSVRGERTLAILNAGDAARMAASLARAAAEINARARLEGDADKAERMVCDAKRTWANANAAANGAKNAALTARALMMVHLKTLAEARTALHGFARMRAIRTKFIGDPRYPDQERRRVEVVAQVAAKALDVWIDPACPHCAGRGFNGGYREPVVICQECDGTTNRISGRRGERLGKTEAAHQFGLSLLEDMDRKTENVERSMRRFMAARERRAEWSDEAQRRMQDRLVELRSAQAQDD